MATRNWSEGNTSFLTGFGGTITDTDDLIIEEGQDYVNTGLDQSAITAESLQIRADVSIGVNEDGTFTADALEIDIDNSSDAYLLHAGGGIVRAAGGALTGAWEILRVQARGQGKMYVGAVDITRAECVSGYTQFGGDADPATLYVAGAGAVVHVLDGTNALPTIYAMAGFLRLERDFGTLYVGADAIVEVDGELITPVAIHQHGGRIRYNGGDIATLNALAGVFDRTLAERAVAIGTAFVDTPAWTFIKSDRASTSVGGTDTPIGGGSKSELG